MLYCIRVKYDKGNLVTDCHRISSRWKNHFSQLLNIHCVCYVRQRDIHTAEPLVCEPRAYDFEMTTEKLNRHRSLSNDQIPAEMIK